MPFLDHFGLVDYPFGLTPNPQLFYPTEEARSLLAGIEFALMRGDGLLKVVGEVGTGKTLVARLLINRLTQLSVNVAYLNIPTMTAAQIPAAVARAFGIKVINEASGTRQLRRYLLDAHANGSRSVLIVDEAQTLGTEGLEAIRLLSNLETETDKLIQIVLFGQKELDTLLHRNELRQVAQRIQFSFMTQPFVIRTAMDYVRFRIESYQAPETKHDIFTYAGLRSLARSSKGLPRVMHLLGDKALMAAYADGEPLVHARHIRAAVRETPDLNLSWWSKWV